MTSQTPRPTPRGAKNRLNPLMFSHAFYAIFGKISQNPHCFALIFAKKQPKTAKTAKNSQEPLKTAKTR